MFQKKEQSVRTTLVNFERDPREFANMEQTARKGLENFRKGSKSLERDSSISMRLKNLKTRSKPLERK